MKSNDIGACRSGLPDQYSLILRIGVGVSQLRSMILAALFLTLAPIAVHAGVADDLAGLSEKQAADVVEFAFDNSLSFLLHETGHLLISEFDLPVLGREEDAADTISTLLMLEMDDPKFDRALVNAVEGWRMSADRGDDNGDMSDAHSLDKQRAFNMICLMVGKDAKKFRHAADDIKLSDDRREECADEYAKAHSSWFGLLKSHIRTDGKQTRFKLTYQKPKDGGLADYADVVKTSNLLEIVKELLNQYKLRDGIKLTAAQCDEANTYWFEDDRELTMCYEFSRDYT